MAEGNNGSEFVCLRCGQCCRLPGFVRVTNDEIARIARFLELAVAEVRHQYVTTMSLGDDQVEILYDHPGTTICIFLNERNECLIHPVKPNQCQTFPTGWKRAGAHLYCAGLRSLRSRKA